MLIRAGPSYFSSAVFVIFLLSFWSSGSLHHRRVWLRSWTKKTRAPCLYYPNSSVSWQLLRRGGDVSVNPGPSTKDCHLKCLSLNAQSLKSKHKSPRSEMFCQIHAFQKLVYSNEYDIICVTETWLKDFFLDSEILEAGYTIFRHDRAEPRVFF